MKILPINVSQTFGFSSAGLPGAAGPLPNRVCDRPQNPSKCRDRTKKKYAAPHCTPLSDAANSDARPGRCEKKFWSTQNCTFQKSTILPVFAPSRHPPKRPKNTPKHESRRHQNAKKTKLRAKIKIPRRQTFTEVSAKAFPHPHRPPAAPKCWDTDRDPRALEKHPKKPDFRPILTPNRRFSPRR